MSQDAHDHMEGVKERMIAKAQAKLPSEHRMAPAAEPFCEVASNDGSYVCTRAQHTDSLHLAHGALGEIHYRWNA